MVGVAMSATATRFDAIAACLALGLGGHQRQTEPFLHRAREEAAYAVGLPARGRLRSVMLAPWGRLSSARICSCLVVAGAGIGAGDDFDADLVLTGAEVDLVGRVRGMIGAPFAAAPGSASAPPRAPQTARRPSTWRAHRPPTTPPAMRPLPAKSSRFHTHNRRMRGSPIGREAQESACDRLPHLDCRAILNRFIGLGPLEEVAVPRTRA